jgi:soluble lytic murein transglycosylase
MLRTKKYNSTPNSIAILAPVLAIYAFAGSCSSAPKSTTPASASSSASGASSPVTPPLPAAGSAPGVPLSKVLQDNLSGLAELAPEERKRLDEETQDYVRFRKMKGDERRRQLDECAEDEPEDSLDGAFCRLKAKVAGLGRGGRHRTPKVKLAKKRLRELQDVMTQTEMSDSSLEEIQDIKDSELIQALKKISDAESLKPLMQALAEKKDCPSPALLNSMGGKAEEQFPDPVYRELAEKLFQRSLDCGSEMASIRSGYRLGLLQVWGRKWDQVEATYAKIVDKPEASDFRSRINYWRLYAAKQRGDSKAQENFRALLAKDQPMSLHGLVLFAPKPTDKMPNILFKSAIKPQLNAAVRAAESLQLQGLSYDSVEALSPLVEQAIGAEPEFRLYLGVLFTRAHDTLNKFKLLSTLLRDSQEMISQASLELLFPLQLFDIIRTHEEQVDPYLVISLIRQESAFNQNARSPVGAMGLMQLMPRTARRMEKVTKSGLLNPKTNIRLGVRFFTRLIERFDGNVEFALAAYNAGPERVDVWKVRYPVDNRLLFLDLSPFKETREYVASIARNYYWYQRLYPSTSPSPAGTIPAAAPATVSDLEKGSIFRLVAPGST